MQVQNAEKVTKINLRIISKPHAHGNFQNDRHKTVGGVGHTRYPLSMAKFKLWKK